MVKALSSHQCGPGSIPRQVEFVVGSRPFPERFFSGYSDFPLSPKTNIYKFQFRDCKVHLIISLSNAKMHKWTNLQVYKYWQRFSHLLFFSLVKPTGANCSVQGVEAFLLVIIKLRTLQSKFEYNIFRIDDTEFLKMMLKGIILPLGSWSIMYQPMQSTTSGKYV